MSITGISAASSAAYIQQLQNATPASTTAQAATPQISAAPQTPAATQTTQTQQPGQVHHHHHHGGGAAAQPTDLTQSGTAATDGTNILNTLV
jgi:hypothetical protein